MAAWVIVVIAPCRSNQASQGVVCIVGTFGVGQILGVVIECVRRDVVDCGGDSLGIVEMGWSRKGRESFAGSAEKSLSVD